MQLKSAVLCRKWKICSERSQRIITLTASRKCAGWAQSQWDCTSFCPSNYLCRMNPALSKFILVPWWPFSSPRGELWSRRTCQDWAAADLKEGRAPHQPPVWRTCHFKTRACRAPGTHCSFPDPSFSFFTFFKSWLLAVNCKVLSADTAAGECTGFSREYCKLQGREESAKREGGRRNMARAIQWSWEICLCQLINAVG